MDKVQHWRHKVQEHQQSDESEKDVHNPSELGGERHLLKYPPHNRDSDNDNHHGQEGGEHVGLPGYGGAG